MAGSWIARAFPSMLGLTAWYADLLQRIKELDGWTADFQMPNCLWLGGLFNPQSLLTAIMQSMARKNEWPLDKMALQCDVTKKNREDMNAPPREGAYISGLIVDQHLSGLSISKQKKVQINGFLVVLHYYTK